MHINDIIVYRYGSNIAVWVNNLTIIVDKNYITWDSNRYVITPPIKELHSEIISVTECKKDVFISLLRELVYAFTNVVPDSDLDWDIPTTTGKRVSPEV